jgi:hypothetical protein
MSGTRSEIGTVLIARSHTSGNPACRPLIPIRGRSVLPGIKLTIYRTKDSPREHGNLQSSAGVANFGKPPSPARSRRGDGVFVVVGARESRVQGEGRQLMSTAARSLG